MQFDLIGHDDVRGDDLPMKVKGMQSNGSVVVEETDLELRVPFELFAIGLLDGDDRADLPPVVR